MRSRRNCKRERIEDLGRIEQILNTILEEIIGDNLELSQDEMQRLYDKIQESWEIARWGDHEE